MNTKPKRPRDNTQITKSIIDIASGEVEDEFTEEGQTYGKTPAAVALGRARIKI
jgi:hypothetical protein